MITILIETNSRDWLCKIVNCFKRPQQPFCKLFSIFLIWYLKMTVKSSSLNDLWWKGVQPTRQVEGNHSPKKLDTRYLFWEEQRQMVKLEERVQETPLPVLSIQFRKLQSTFINWVTWKSSLRSPCGVYRKQTKSGKRSMHITLLNWMISFSW